MQTKSAKELLAEKALEFVRDGAVVGLGSGSTAKAFIEALGRLAAAAGIRPILVATSADSELKAIEAGLGPYLRPLWAIDSIDLAVDGADEVTRDRVFLKGRGGALLREKVVDYRASTLLILAEARKLVPSIPHGNPIPIEVVPVAWRHVARDIERKFGGRCVLRTAESGRLGPHVTDNGNYIIDWTPSSPVDAEFLELALKEVPGVIETGIFARRRDAAVLLADEGAAVRPL